MKNDGGKIVTGYVIDNSQLKASAEQAKNVFKDVGRTIDSEGNKMDGTVKKLAAGIGAFFSIQQASLFVNKLIDVRSEFQSLQIGLETILGSKEKADKLFREVVDFAAKTPFELKDVGAGVKQLLAYGTQAEDAIEVTRRLGDISAGLSIPLGDLVYLYGTTQVQGKLFTMDLRQFMGRGIPLAEELAKQFGVAKNEVAGLVTAGKVGFPEVEKAIKSMTDEGGKFAGLTEKNSQTIKGQMSNLKDTIAEAYNEIGAANEGILYGGVHMASYLVKNYETIGKVIAGLVITYGAYKAALMVATVANSFAAQAAVGNTAAMVIQAKWTALVTKGQKLLNWELLKSPYAIATIAVIGLVAGLAALASSAKKAITEQELLNEVGKQAASNTMVEANEVKSLEKILNNTNKSYGERKTALDKLQTIVPSYHASLTAEGKLINNNADALDGYVKKLVIAEKIKLLVSKSTKASEDFDEFMEENKDVMRSVVRKQANGEGLLAGERAAVAISQRLAQDVETVNTVIDKLQSELVSIEAKTPQATGGGGDDLGKPTKGKTALELEQEQQKILSDQERNILEANRRIEDMQFESEQNQINLQKDGYQKRYEQLELDLKRKKIAIARSQEDELAKLVEQEREKARIEKRSFDASSVQLPDGFKKQYANSYVEADVAYYSEQKSLFNEVLGQYKDYEQQRADIVKKYADDRKILEKSGTDEAKQALKELSKQEQKALMDFDLMVSGKNSVMSKLFSDSSNFTLGQLTELQNQAEELFMFLQGGRYSEIQGKLFGISQKEFEEFIKPENLSKFRDGLEKVKNSIYNLKSPTDRLKQSLEDLFNPELSGTLRQKEALEDVKKSVEDVLDVVQELGELYSSIAGLAGSGGGMADNIEKTVSILSDVTATVGAAMSGDFIQTAKGYFSYVTKIINWFAENKKSRDKLKEEIKDTNLTEYLGQIEVEAVYRQKYEWTQKIGEATLYYIKREGDELKKQANENEKTQSELLSKLYGTEYKSGETFEKTGLFGWGKGKINTDWASLAGKTWKEIEVLAAGEKLSEEGQKYYEALKKAKEEGSDIEQLQVEYLEKLRETYTGTSYESLVSGIVEAFKDSKRNASDFADSFEELMKGAVQSALELMADDKMRTWYESWAEMGKDGYTKEEIEQAKKDYIQLLNNLNADAKALEDATGVSIANSQSQGAATKGSWQTISSDQADRLDGRATAILQVNTESLNTLKNLNMTSIGIANSIGEVRNVAIDSWSELVSIRKNTALIAETNQLLKGVKKGIEGL